MKSFAEIYAEAEAAGLAAGEAVNPTPMVVGLATSLFGNEIVPGTEEVVPEGVCGFAWIVVKDARRKFPKWLIENGYARRSSYYKGAYLSVSSYNQSMERKEAHAYAMADVLSSYGINCYASSRMD